MAVNWYRRKFFVRKQYTFTRAKMILIFIITLPLSMVMTKYLDKYGYIIIEDLKNKFQSLSQSINDSQQRQMDNYQSSATYPAPQNNNRR